MATDMKRFTISVTKEMESDLDRMKQKKYYNTTRNRMIQDLIILGLQVMKEEILNEKKEEELWEEEKKLRF